MIGGKMDKKYLNEYLDTTTVEGYYTLKSFYTLTHNKRKKNTIIDILYEIIYNNSDLKLLDNYLRK